MTINKPVLIIQLRPEDITADSELAAILRYGKLQADDIVRLRAEQQGLPELDLDRYSAIIVGGSPFDISTPDADKSATQRQIETGFMRLLEQITKRDFPFLGCCSGNGLLAKFCGSSISRRFAEPVGGVDITLTAAARQDPLLQEMPATFRVMVACRPASCNRPLAETARGHHPPARGRH